jgi:hypothetical protein
VLVREQNILTVFNQATADEIQQGKHWYADAHKQGIRLSKTYGISVYAACGIIAAVSPGLRWERNVEVAERIIQGRELDGLGVRWYANVRKAKLIRNGQKPENILRGNKVRSFYDNIVQPDRSLCVCIDGHAWAIAHGKRIRLDAVPPIGRRAYNRLSASYAVVAKHLGLRPCQLQAVVWVVWRRLYVAPIAKLRIAA